MEDQFSVFQECPCGSNWPIRRAGRPFFCLIADFTAIPTTASAFLSGRAGGRGFPSSASARTLRLFRLLRSNKQLAIRCCSGGRAYAQDNEDGRPGTTRLPHRRSCLALHEG